jgi:hypothetical protein
MTKFHDLNDIDIQQCENCGADSKILFPLHWKWRDQLYSSDLCIRCLRHWIKTDQIGRMVMGLPD